MTQKLWIYDDEMAGKSKKEHTKMKDLLSKQTFSLREPYGKSNVDLERIAVLCASTNNFDILNDPTGSRRFICVRVESINHSLYNSIDKTELWLEAYHLYKSGFDWELTKEDIHRLESSNEDFQNYSIEYELLSQYVTKPDILFEYVTATQIKVQLEAITKQKLIVEKLGSELARLGFERVCRRIDGSPKKCWKIGRIIGAAGDLPV